jgi:thiamine pyrophosphate-dependent acetolactate synthase large subunit-like protein
LQIDLGHDPARGLDIRQVFVTLDKKLPADRIVVSDAGRGVHSLPVMLNARDARSWLPSRGYGSLALGMGAAIGAAAAAPDRPVAVFCGDGGFMMAAQELDAIRLNELNVTVVVLNDEQYGDEVQYLRSNGLPTDVVRMSMPDTVMLARAFGGDGIVIESAAELADVELPSKGLFLIEARCDPQVNGRAMSPHPHH